VNQKFLFDPNYIQWYDGMPISCHHFQQAEIRNHKVLQYLFEKLNPYGWGVLDLEVDIAGINSMKVIINRLEAIMPDYSLLFASASSDQRLEINLPKLDQGEVHTIYCCLSTDHIIFHEDKTKNRYRSIQADSVLDNNTGDNRVPIVKLVPNPYLTIQKPDNTCLYMPLIKFILQDGSVKILDYDPPTPNFNLATHSKSELSQILKLLFEKLQEAYSKIKIKQSSHDFEHYGQLIAREIWPLQSLLNSTNPNTFMIYQSIVRLCASLTAILDESIPEFHESYHHDNILASFKKLFAFIENKLKVINKLHSIGLNQFSANPEKRIFSINLPVMDSKRIKVLMQFKENFDFNTWINNCIIVSQSMLEETKLNRLLGCKREIVDSSRMVDGIRFITVEISLEQYYIKDRKLIISNQINPEILILSIYLLD